MSGTKRPRSDYYDRLLFQCQKELHKLAKQTKQFETKKLIRQLKTANNEEATTKQIETKLTELKEYDVDPVVQECVRRLGLPALNPNGGETLPDIRVEASWMLDRIVHHKRMKGTMEKWHEEVAKYRRWCAVDNGTNKFVARENSLFVQLGKSTAETNEPKQAKPKKKNRQGQRARKAKALSLAARQEGRTLLPEESLNWRAKKKAPANERNDPTPSMPQARTQPPAPTHEAPLHPSWQARKETKNGIVAFQGKKITF